jgi:hypothetical protein
MSCQAPVQAQPQRQAADLDVNVRHRVGSRAQDIHDHEYDDWYAEDGRQGYDPPQQAQADALPRHPSSLRPRPTQVAEHSDNGNHRQPLPHGGRDTVESQHSHVPHPNHPYSHKTSRKRDLSVEPPPKKRKIHDIDNHTPRQILPMPHWVGNQVAGPSRSRPQPLPESSDAGPSRPRQRENQAFGHHSNHEFSDDQNSYERYNDAGYYYN